MATGNPYLPRDYTGELAEPINPGGGDQGGLLGGPVGPAEIDQLRGNKMPALFEHFGIDAAQPDAWQRLARALAERHVPGFSVGFPVPDWSSIQTNPLLLANPFLAPLATPLLAWPLKGKRGRPKKPPLPGALVGLLGSVTSKPVGRPPVPIEQKARAVELFASIKSEDEKDFDTARRIATAALPDATRQDKIKAEALRIVRKVKRLRCEVRKFHGNSEPRET